MIKYECCGAEKLFDLEGAQKKMKMYKRKGAGNATKKLLSQLYLQNLTGKTLLDVGGGIGAIQWGFLERGGAHTTDVDASTGYLEVAKSYAIEHGFAEKTTFLHGDLTEKAKELTMYDYVTLDKVVCCYPDYVSLLNQVLDRCNTSIALTFPLEGPISKIFAFFENVYFTLKKIHFQTYIHSPADIEKFIRSKGFEPIQKKVSFPWHVQVYSKIKE